MDINRFFTIEFNDESRVLTVTINKDDDKYKDDIVVGLNGKVYRIQRGKHVRIPRPVYNIIRRSMAQDAATAEMLEEKAREYEAVKQQLN